MVGLGRHVGVVAISVALLAGCGGSDSQLTSAEREALDAQCTREGVPADMCGCISGEVERQFEGAERAALVEQLAAQEGAVPSEIGPIVDTCSRQVGWDPPAALPSTTPPTVDQVALCTAQVESSIGTLPDLVAAERDALEGWTRAVDALDQSSAETRLSRLEIEDAVQGVEETEQMLASLPADACGMAGDPLRASACVRVMIENTDLAREWEEARLRSEMIDEASNGLAPEVAPSMESYRASQLFSSIRQTDAILLSGLFGCHASARR